jgi:hypothetical protein
VLTAAAVCVAGCVSMPASGPMGAISASPQTTAGGGDFIEPFTAGPSLDEGPANIVYGFLAASANYPVNASIAREYLTSSGSKNWNPSWQVTVFTSITVAPPTQTQIQPQPQTSKPGHGGQQAEMEASGVVQSSFNGSGQFVSAATKNDPTSYTFKLTKVNGQWRISNPPKFRLLTGPQFLAFYKAQDLYFINPNISNTQNTSSSQNQPLVPDSVFVPLVSATTELATNLVKALLPASTGGPQSALLQKAAGTFPAGTKLGSVALDGTTAVVNLGGLAGASTLVREQISAQLAWTLATPRAGPPSAIQSIELELNGKPWIPPEPPDKICGITQTRSAVQNQATYPCFNPYPSQPASFFFTDHGQVWSRCGSEANAQRGLVGPVVSVFQPGSTASSQQCGNGSVTPSSTSAPTSGQLPPKYGTPTIAAVSPDGAYVAWYSPDTTKVYAGLTSTAGTVTAVPGVAGPGVTALSWDRSHNLWIAQGGNVLMAPVNGKATAVTTGLTGTVTGLSVAPDGVRVALIVAGGSPSATGVELEAIVGGGQSSQVQRGSPSEAVALDNAIPLGPDLVQPTALTWYDADDLIVLSGSSVRYLSQVPVDGQDSASSQLAPDGAESITADGATNALVAGLSDGQMAVSTGLEGPWQSLGVDGLNPTFPG